MDDAITSINYLAVVVAAVLEFGLGALWYGPLFGKVWMAAVGLSEEEIQSGNPAQSMAYRGLATLVAAYVLAHIINLAGATTLGAGLETGFWLWLGFIATFTLDSVLFEKRPLKVWIINNAYHLVGMLIMGAVLALWR